MKQKTITFALVLLVGTVGMVGISINNVSATKNLDKYEYTRDNPSPEYIVYSSIQEYSTFNQNNGETKNYNFLIKELGYDKLIYKKAQIMDMNISKHKTIEQNKTDADIQQIDNKGDKTSKFRYIRKTLSNKDTVYSSIQQYSTFQDYENNKNQDYYQTVRNLGFR